MKRGIVINNSKIPAMLSWFIEISAITLWPFIISRGEPSEVTINHERIHIAQQGEMLVLFFYLAYAFFWLKNKAKGYDDFDAYLYIPFEKEAYSNQNDLEYLEKRKPYSWVKYI